MRELIIDAAPTRLASFMLSEAARTIVVLNIEHFEGLLKAETDPHKRKTIARLLAEEKAKLAETTAPKTKET